MRVLTRAEYVALTTPPETVVEGDLFESLLARGLLVVAAVDPVTFHRFTNLTTLGVLAKRLYESGACGC